MKAAKGDNDQIEPTKSELEILQVLWKSGHATVRSVNEQLNKERREVQYASTLKLMQLMVEKGLLRREGSGIKHVYEAAIEEEKTKSYLLDRFIETMYNGSVGSLMMQVLGNKKASAKDLDLIRQMLKDKGKNL